MKKVFLPIFLTTAATVGIVLCGCAPAANAKVVKIELPVESVTSYKTAPGVELANAQCLTCHSVDYTVMQPGKPRDFWKAEVEKMIGKYAAPIPPEQTNALINYFALNYGTEKDAAALSVAVAPSAPPAPSGTAGKDLAIKSGCFNCHSVKTKIIGPAYKDVAAKYASDPKGPDAVVDQIIHGGAGKWGPFPMPPFKQFSKEELKLLSDWILSLK